MGGAATRDRYPDALRAGALLVVVFGHWIATLPRLEGGRMVATEHLLTLWDAAGVLTWVLQVVPLFVFVSAAVSTDGVSDRIGRGDSQRVWWAGRALGLARPTVTYLAVLAVMAVIALRTGGRLLGPLDRSLTVHLWFLVMLLAVQALLPLGVRADARYGLRAVGGLLLVAVLVDLTRGGVTSLGDLARLGELVTGRGGGIGWLNTLVVWLVPQQLGIAWRRGRFGGTGTGAVLVGAGLFWLGTAVATGYPPAMVGGELDGSSNVLPPTLGLVGVMWVQVGAVLLFERPARRALRSRPVGRIVAILGALGMPLYLWHKLAELPAAWLGERLGAPIDAGVPGEAGFWAGRLAWIALCILVVTPVMAAVIAFETRREPKVPQTTRLGATVIGGVALFGGIVVAMALGAQPGAVIGVLLVGVASWSLRRHRADRPPTTEEGPPTRAASRGVPA
ncbi:MAG: acyltransferase family protein [Nitriliruptor sp.]